MHSLFTRTWWIYSRDASLFEQLYHWLNLVEGAAWIGFAALVLQRYLRHRHSKIEMVYAAAFLTFGISDFWEAYRLTSWLILFKGANLLVLIYLRRTVLRRFYPNNRTF